VNVAAGFDLQLQPDPYQPTDVATFNQAGVPCLNFFTGTHVDYHRPTDTADKIEVLLEVFSLEARRIPAVIVRRKIFEAFDLTGEKAAAERAIGNEGNSQLTGCRQDFIFRIAAPQRVFRLQRGDRMHFVRAPNGAGGSLGQSEVANFARFHQLRHRTDRFFDRHSWIDAVLVIQVDSFHAQAFQTVIAARAEIFGFAVHAAHRRIRFAAHNSEFRRQENLVAQTANGIADQNLVIAVTVNVRSIKKRDAEFDGAMNRGYRFRVVTRSIEFRHPHAAQTYCGYERTVFS